MAAFSLAWLARRQNYFLLGAAVALILAALLPRLWLLEIRFFDRDEFEHLHTAWLTFEGYLPYRDFFQNHTPLLYFVLAPLYLFYDVAHNPDDAVAAIFAARRLMWLLAGSILALTYLLGAVWRGWRVGVAGAVLLAHTIMFLQKTLEIRPDLISTACWMGSLVLLLVGVQSARAEASRTRWRFALSGVLLGIAIMATQKMLFAGPGLTLTTLWYLFDRRSHGPFKAPIINVLFQAAGVSLPILVVLGFFAARGGLDEFIYFNWTLNAAWQIKFSPGPSLRQLRLENGWLVALALIGILGISCRMFGRHAVRRGDYIIALNGIGLFAGLFIISVPHRQYFLMFLPLVALYAATALVDGTDMLVRRCNHFRPPNETALVAAGVFLLVLFAATAVWAIPGNPKAPIGLKYMILITAFGIASAALHLLAGCKSTALAIVLVMASIQPLRVLHGAFYGLSNQAQIRNVRYVLENTSAEDAVMDGQEGVGLFRPHAYFYWLLDPNIRLLLTLEEKQKLLETLQRGEVAPKLVNLDDALKDLSPEITKFFEANYEAVQVGRLRLRKENSLRMN